MKEKKKVSLKAIKIGLLGDSQVGKTAICRAFLKNDFDPDILSTIGNIKMETKYQLKNGETIKLILWDSAGQERFRSVAMSTLKAVKGIILVFDMILEESFKSVSTWIKQIDENLNNPYLILFGNKIDIDKSEWKVNQEEIKKFVEEKKMPYFETSAKDNKGIKEGFDYLINEVYEKIHEQKEEEKNIVIQKEDENIEKKEEIEEKKSGCFGWMKKKKKSNQGSISKDDKNNDIDLTLFFQ